MKPLKSLHKAGVVLAIATTLGVCGCGSSRVGQSVVVFTKAPGGDFNPPPLSGELTKENDEGVWVYEASGAEGSFPRTTFVPRSEIARISYLGGGSDNEAYPK